MRALYDANCLEEAQALVDDLYDHAVGAPRVTVQKITY